MKVGVSSDIILKVCGCEGSLKTQTIMMECQVSCQRKQATEVMPNDLIPKNCKHVPSIWIGGRKSGRMSDVSERERESGLNHDLADASQFNGLAHTPLDSCLYCLHCVICWGDISFSLIASLSLSLASMLCVIISYTVTSLSVNIC